MKQLDPFDLQRIKDCKKRLEKIGVDFEQYSKVNVEKLMIITEGHELGLDVSVFFRPGYTGLSAKQMKEVLLGMKQGLPIEVYNNRDVPSLSMYRVRMRMISALKNGLSKSEAAKVGAKLCEELVKNIRIDKDELNKKMFSPEQEEELEKIRQLGIDTLSLGYEKSTLKPGTLRQIRLGYEAGVDVSQYFRKGYRMREWQMHEIRLGLEAGIDVSSYNIKGTPPDKMCEIRGWKTHSTPELEKLAKQIDVSEEKDIYLKDRVLRRILSLDQVKEDYEFAKMVVGDYVPTKSNIVFAYSRHENKVSNLQLIMRGILIVNLGREKYTKELQEELKKLIHSKEEIILDSYNIPDTKKYLSEFLEEKIGKNLFDAYQVFKGTEPKDENNRYDNALNHFEKEFLKMKINLPFGEEED